MKSSKVVIPFAIAISLIPILYLAYIYNALPATVPTHFDAGGKPNDYSSKSTLFLITAGMSAIAMGVFFLIRNLEKIDPKKFAKSNPGSMNKIAIGLVIFLSTLNVIIVSSAQQGKIGNIKLVMCLIGLFLAFMGNVMYSVKPNYFVGIRTPWTLENEDNWRKTHQIAGKLWVAGGLLITVLALILPGAAFPYFLLPTVALMVLIPVAYSFIEFKKSQKINS